MRRNIALKMARVFSEVDLLLVPSLRDEMMGISITGHPSLTMRAGFVEVAEARSNWAPDTQRPTAAIQSSAPGASRRHAHGATVR